MLPRAHNIIIDGAVIVTHLVMPSSLVRTDLNVLDIYWIVGNVVTYDDDSIAN